MLTLAIDDRRAVAVIGAIQSGDVAGLRQQLDENPGLARTRIVDGKGFARTLLHVAADWPGHFPNGSQTVAALIAAGADVNAAVQVQGGPNGSPETALHWAASCDDVAVLDALIDGGADIEAPGAVFTGGSPMSDAVVFAQWNAARRLLERGAKTTVWQAAALGLSDAVMQRFTTPPQLSKEEVTNCFWHACRGGHLEVSNYLLERGAELNWVGYGKRTPLDVARESGEAELVRWLEGYGARSAQEPI